MQIIQQTNFAQAMRAITSVFLATLTLPALSSTAFAHHGMDGQLPQTFIQGLISGFAHPIIGLDHLAFIIAVGIASAFVPKGWLFALSFVVATMFGAFIHLQSINLPMAELVVAASVILVGLLLAFAIEVRGAVWLALFSAAGLFHGYAYAESIIGAEQAPLGAYLLGLCVIQSVIALMAFAIVKNNTVGQLAQAQGARIAAGCVLGVGLTIMASHLV